MCPTCGFKPAPPPTPDLQSVTAVDEDGFATLGVAEPEGEKKEKAPKKRRRPAKPPELPASPGNMGISMVACFILALSIVANAVLQLRNAATAESDLALSFVHVLCFALLIAGGTVTEGQRLQSLLAFFVIVLGGAMSFAANQRLHGQPTAEDLKAALALAIMHDMLLGAAVLIALWRLSRVFERSAIALGILVMLVLELWGLSEFNSYLETARLRHRFEAEGLFQWGLALFCFLSAMGCIVAGMLIPARRGRRRLFGPLPPRQYEAVPNEPPLIPPGTLLFDAKTREPAQQEPRTKRSKDRFA